MRRWNGSWTAAAAVALILAALTPTAPRPAEAQETAAPNVLIIVTDDQRADMMEVMPRTRRWFGAGGTRFSNGFATTPLCCPARASIFTGQYTHNHGVRSNVEAPTLDQDATVQHALDGAGYRTGLVGKYLNGWDLETPPPDFDRFSTFIGGYFDRPFNVNGRVARLRGYSTDVVGRQALRFLRGSEGADERPWLLFVTPFAPHAPWSPAGTFDGAEVPPWSPNPAVLEEDVSDKPHHLQVRSRTAEHAEVARTERLQTLMSVDVMVGKVMRELGTLGERSDTLAFFLSDNGFLEAEHGAFGKRMPYEQSIRVPFFARWPDGFQAGDEDDRLVANIDIAPTVYEAAGVAPPTEVDGRSLLDPNGRDHLLVEYDIGEEESAVPTWAAIVTETEKYVEYYGDEEAVVFREYYDLEADPWELHNLVGDLDVTNDPSASKLAQYSLQIRRDVECSGTSGPLACP